jgi:hypothetical protein
LDYVVKAEPRYGYGKPAHPRLYELIGRDRSIYRHYLQQFAAFRSDVASIDLHGDTEALEPLWVNAMLPGLDGLSIFGMLAIHRPKRYFEIGSGNSTKFARFAISARSLKTSITSIDPAPRASIDQICDRIIRLPLEEVALTEFDALEPGDIIFIDNSHRVFMNSDVTVTFLDILPRLRPGVIVGLHDINLPYDYEPGIVDRYYSEQYLLAVHLLAEGKRTRNLLPCYFVTMDEELRSILKPLWADPRLSTVNPSGSSFWLQIL